MITDDARERFLREIVEHVPADRIAELHLFRPLRRGGTETGVAVIAVEQEAPPQTEVSDDQAAADASSDRSAMVEASGDPTATADQPLLVTDARVIDTLPDETDDLDEESFSNDEDSPYAEEHRSDAALDGAEASRSSADISLVKSAPARPARHTVFTARYRLTRKGADRGKWEFEVVADADAPLGTVDTVVRGVQRRAGDDEEPERLTAEGVRAALDGQAWRQTT